MNLNLCTDSWLKFRLASGEVVALPLKELGREDLLDVVLPRQDFYGAGWQFLIGILQTVFALADEEEWLDWYESPPSPEVLAAALSKVEHAFELFGDGPCFMQDWEPLEDGTYVDISSLLIDAPGGNTLKLNTDHFIKRGQVNTLSPAMAAMALFTLQINAPAGGQGHRTGLRGGGPLTTLVVSNDSSLSLFRRLWLNIAPIDCDLPRVVKYDESIFPWLAPTRTSKEKGTEVYLNDESVHPLQQYWAMPRRIRLELAEAGSCDLTHEHAGITVTGYRTKNYGANYGGTWAHPLTPYRFDPKNPELEHFSSKGQPGGIGYRQWHQFLFENHAEGHLPAKVVARMATNQELLEEELEFEDQLSVWVFGFDMDNMKARSWHAAKMPLLSMPVDSIPLFVQEIFDQVQVANDYRKALRKSCENAWFSDPDKKKKIQRDLGFIDEQFWTETEQDFYSMIDHLKIDIEAGEQKLNAQSCQNWLGMLKQHALLLFDALVLSDASQTEHIERKLRARRSLEWIKLNKAYLQKHGLDKKGVINV
ncbi:type I-E CRISPR-associated protein Cse1/CasA [Gilvimarinus agarilyticus]|uniref:type I-E CRISPR-associated protein Cse1/CasA n=1 Tax=Gilvimarinus sp. 2_MG-2023 TaxID=3062666 RepID=UPI001C09FA37|nr:type I-E CRISPR-associated protein Cse1/CasA [Gilvimarinus sp. 2_MG-2023]MBU2885472.1 type I-E CRISPR-associated protein Cse1/CasA [Gilvimarinus agarilyticus]MDO6570372.1 type I-E CRISPR-associated protein Cse1/CasA [Gilvimarinus sp. 2_MG-2023]